MNQKCGDLTSDQYIPKRAFENILRRTSADRTGQRIEFANGAAAEFDMAENQFMVTGIAGFTGEWETPEDLY